MATTQRIPAHFQGELNANGLGSIYAVDPNSQRVSLPVPDAYVVDGFTWGSASTESGRATAACLIIHLAACFDNLTVTDESIQRLVDGLVSCLAHDHGWAISSLEVYDLLVNAG